MALNPISTTAGSADTLPAGAAKVNTMFAEFYERRGFPKQFRVVFYGDSKSNLMGALQNRSSWKYAMNEHPVDWLYAGNVGVGGAVVNTAQLASDATIATMTGCMQYGGGSGNVLVWKGFTNDSGQPVETDMGCFRKIHLAARKAGAVLTIIMGLNPYASDTGQKFAAMNVALRQYAEQNADCWYIDTVPALIDITSGTFSPRTVPYPVLIDGVHEGPYGAYLEGVALGQELRRRGVPRRVLDYTYLADHASRGGGSTGNIFGSNGGFQNPGNAAGMQVTGGAGVTGAANFTGANGGDNYVRLTGGMTGTMALAITTVPCAVMNTAGQRTDVNCCRLTFSGTPTAEANINLQFYTNMYATYGGGATLPQQIPLIQEVTYQMNALTGLYAYSGIIGGPGGDGLTAAYNLPAITQLVQDRSPTPTVSGASGFGTYEAGGSFAGFFFRANVPCSGSVDLISASTRWYMPNQTPAA